MNKVICLKKYKQCKRHKIPAQAAIKIAQADKCFQDSMLKRKTYKTRSKLPNFR
ncbi:MAG: hypothetical protein LBL30_00990 [Holosporales bacterium]|jgi:hypothetical protein|nr:hypothetical protein [Holosporales bacterium]